MGLKPVQDFCAIRTWNHTYMQLCSGNYNLFTVSSSELPKLELSTYVACKNLSHFLKIKHFKNQKISWIKVGLLDSLIFFKKKSERLHWFSTLKNDFENQNLECSKRLFIILVSLTVTLFIEKMFIVTKSCHRRTYQTYEQLPQTSKKFWFSKSFFSVENWLNLSKKRILD